MKSASLLLLAAASACVLSATAFAADPKDDLVVAMKAQNDAPAFRAKIATTESTSKMNTTITMEAVKPDQIHVKTEMPQMSMEMFSDGKRTVMSQGGGAFMDAPPQVAGMLAQVRQQATMDAAVQAAKNVKVVGHESVNGGPATVYTYDAEMMGMHSTNKLWVLDKGHLPAKSESDVHGSVDMGGQPGPTVNMKVDASFDYDPSIKVVMPAK